jgi:hypothetical protein
MVRYVGGQSLPIAATAQERQASEDARQSKVPPEGACPDCLGRGYLTGLCMCTREGKPTAATAECRECAGRGFVRTPCFPCDGSGTVAGAAAAKQRRDREADWASRQHDNIMNAIGEVARLSASG